MYIVEIQKFGYFDEEKWPTSIQCVNSHAKDLSGGG